MRVRAITLIETIIAMTIVAILMGAMVSLVLASSRLVPGKSSPATAAGSAASFLEEFASDVRGAIAIVAAGPTSLEIAVGDRDGDGKEESIRYEWSGAGGASIERVYNYSWTSLELPVDAFTLTYATASINTASKDVATEQPEASVGGWSSGLTLYSSRPVDSSKAVAQHFVPTLPANARSWTITRVRFLAQGDLLAATGTTAVQIQTVGADGKPTGTVLGTVSVAESSLNTIAYAERTVTIAGCPPLAPGQEVAIVFQCTANCPSMTMGYVALGTPRNPPMSVNGPSWSTFADGAIPHEVWAKATIATANVSSTRRLERITVELTPTGATAPLRSSITLHNQPEVQ